MFQFMTILFLFLNNVCNDLMHFTSHPRVLTRPTSAMTSQFFF
jgi:hypothetical protein